MDKHYKTGLLDEYTTGQGFVYYQDLLTNKSPFWRSVGIKAKSNLEAISSNFSEKASDLGKIKDTLILLGQRERANELSLLQQYFGYTGKEVSLAEYPNFIKDINLLMGLKNEFKNHLTMLEKTMFGKSRAQTAASFFESYLASIYRDEIIKIFDNTAIMDAFIKGEYSLFKEKIDEIEEQVIQKAIEATSKQKDVIIDENGQEQVVQIWQMISKLNNSLNFSGFRDMLDIRFNLPEIANSLIQWKEQRLKSGKTSNHGLLAAIKRHLSGSEQKSRSIAGFIAEFTDSMMFEVDLKEGKSISHVMKSNMTVADSTVLYTKNTKINTKEVFEELDSISGSSLQETREKLVRFSNEFLEKMDSNFIQYNNVKNYGLGDSFSSRGFETKRGTTALKELFTKLGTNADDLLEALYNTGNRALLANDTSLREEIKTQMAQLVAYILFDDWETIGVKGGRAIHIFDLDGVLVPLSYLLLSMGNAISNVESKLSSFFRVRISTPGAIFDTPIKLGDEENIYDYWVNQSNQSKTKTEITIQFLSNFKDLIHQTLNTFK